MRHPSVIWVAGIFASALAHVVFAALLVWSVRPEPVEYQPSPQSEIELQAYRIPRSEAVPQQPEIDPAAQANSRGEDVAAGAVPQSKAQSMPPQADPVPSSQPNSTALTATQDPAPRAKPLAPPSRALASAPPATHQVSASAAPLSRLSHSPLEPTKLTTTTSLASVAVTAATLPSTQTQASSQPTPVILAAAAVQPDTATVLIPTAPPLATSTPIDTPSLQQQTPDPTKLTEAHATPVAASWLAPDPRPLALTPPNSTPSPVQVPESTALADHPPTPVAAVLSEPEIPHIKAALAFSGDTAGQADPISLTAFQSFMRPGDIAQTGDPLRDGVAGILAAVPCSRLQVVFDPETATLNLRGHVPESGLRAPVLAALQAQMGADIQVSDQMKILPRPQCGALAGISNVGLPQSTDQITNPRLIGADTHARVLDYVAGDRLFFDLGAPDYDAYVYVDYFDAGGAVLHLAPNQAVPLVLTSAQHQLRVGAKTEQDIGLQITVGPPFGQEIAVAFAASHPLYQGVRPITEDAAPYLTWLSERVAEARVLHPDFKGEWVYFFVSTAAQ